VLLFLNSTTKIFGLVGLKKTKSLHIKENQQLLENFFVAILNAKFNLIRGETGNFDWSEGKSKQQNITPKVDRKGN
jgi:hypothetical protein